jgi:hypothetical protein
MRVPPYALRIRIAEQERTKFRIWFPLFLLWPLILVFLLLTLIATLVVDAAQLIAGRRRCYTRLVVGCLGLVGETRGTELFIEDKSRTVAVMVR